MLNMTKQTLLTGILSLILANLAVAAPEFTPNSQPTGWVSRPVVTFYDVSSGDRNFFQLDYRKDSWVGDVLAKDISDTARVQSTGPWDNVDPTLTTAATLLNSMDYSSGRKIATLAGAFTWANMSPAQKTAIGSEEILNYVRGDRSNEEPSGLSLRFRPSVFGDVLHSTINYWEDSGSETLYVGANDGMLHSINATSGAENWAYVPSVVIPNLHKLARKPYVHTHFVDGPISIANVDVSGVQKTILVGALGAGGAGLYALDITTPSASNEADVANKVLWEIGASGSFANLGHTYGTPQIARLNSGTAAVIFGNGYMNAGNGHAVLYVVNAMTGALISAIDTGSGSTASPNGLSSPALYDANGDGRADYAYAGDIDGHLWKFNLSTNSSSLLFTTSPVQAITTAPVARAHPLGGQMVAFATGRILTSGDKLDTNIHYAYGIWDGAPVANNALLTQTLSGSTYGGVGVRTITSNAPDWSAGSGHHKGWKVALWPGERAVGEMPFYNNGRFYFLSTNPSIDPTENWLHELVFTTGGSPLGPIFDLSLDGFFNDSDLAANGGIPVAKYLGSGVFSQPRFVKAVELSTTLYAFHPDLPVTDGVPTEPPDPGVSGGHFDFDIYYYEDTDPVLFPSDDGQTTTICDKKKDIGKEYFKISPACIASFDTDYAFLSEYKASKQKCDGKKVYIDITCNTYTYTSAGEYAKVKHEHEYDDKYDVTGVNMLNASLTDFNLSDAIPNDASSFKILVMNQYLNPAATISVGGVDYESVTTFGGLATQTDPRSLLGGLQTYSRSNIGTFIYNLPLDAFKSKDWWGDGGAVRAGLIPTQTGCVNKVDSAGVVETPGPNGERFNGALTIQLIHPRTPSSALEFNGPDVSYGWRVRAADFTAYVLAEYTSFWHHPNGECYGDSDWIPDPPEDFESDGKSEVPAPGSADPRDGVFGAGLAIVSVVTEVVGNVTTTTTTYSDGSEYIKTETKNADGSTTVHQLFRDGTEETVSMYSGNGGVAGFIDPNTGSPEEEQTKGYIGRQTWSDMLDD